MRAGEFPDGAHVLRAKIDMASPNFNMRDPTLYRIRHAAHHRTGDAWCIYPMYDYAHPLSDAHRADHALALHARVRGSSAALRLAGRPPHRRRQAAADRVRAAEPELHGDEQAQAAAARAAGARLRLGRSADADDQRPAPPRLHAGVDPRLLRAHRRREEGKRHRRRAARAQHPRGSEPARAARDGGAASAEGRADELPGGPGRGGRRHQQPGGRVGGHAQGAVLARAVHRARRLHGGSAEEVLPALARQGSAPALRLLHHLHRGRQGRARRDVGAALHLRSGDARRRFAGRPTREGDAALGVGGARAPGRGAARTIGCSRSRIRRTCRRERRSSTT